ncbi:MAG: DUF2314 domain-containing protein [Verrucomicrobiales bacterium]|nr:DUF2314 domain-containing protein [Verrucomicrobiales bacterium]
MHRGGEFEGDLSLSPRIRFDEAASKAQATFRFFWRELSWERRRIIPALEQACVKVPFSDDDAPSKIEHMWISEIDFDGKVVSGYLINEPNELKSVTVGQKVEVPLSGIEDWVFAIAGKAYGAFTVNLIRTRMSAAERKAHDAAWGLDFGDPKRPRLYPDENSEDTGLIDRLFPNNNRSIHQEHPMSLNMVPKFVEYLDKNPHSINQPDENGWTMLHSESLAGNRAPVEILLAKGADHTQQTRHGMTALDLAESLQWHSISEVLRAVRD